MGQIPLKKFRIEMWFDVEIGSCMWNLCRIIFWNGNFSTELQNGGRRIILNIFPLNGPNMLKFFGTVIEDFTVVVVCMWGLQ